MSGTSRSINQMSDSIICTVQSLAVQCQTQAWLVQRRMPHVQKDLQRAVKREDLMLCTSYESQLSRVTKPNPQPEGAAAGKCHSNFLIDKNRAAALHFLVVKS